MTTRSGRAAIRMAGLAVALAALVSGCVSLQANGPINTVTEGDEGSSQVQIWPSPPAADEAPAAIVAGFLEAARSGAANLLIADAYLTTDMQKQWKSGQDTVIVLADDSESTPQPPGQQQSADQSGDASTGQIPAAGQDVQTDSVADGTEITEQVQGTVLGTVDSSGLYSATNNLTSTSYDFGLTATKDGYRISSLPAGFGVLMERSDFESSYNRHDVYYVNAQHSDKLIPTQIYLPALDTDQEIATAMARLIVQGVPEQLGAAAQESVAGADFDSVEFGGDGAATVAINSHGSCVKSTEACVNLGRQLVATLNSLSTKVTSVTITDQANKATYPPVNVDGSLIAYAPNQGSRAGQSFFAIADDGSVEQISTSGSVSATQTGFGPAKTKFRQVAVGPALQVGGTQPIALVSQDGTKVYVPHKQDNAYQLTQVYPSASTPTGGTASGLSWDDYGNLWFTVTLGGNTVVYRYGQDSLSRVAVTGLSGKVTQVAAAPDGARVAVGYQNAEDQSCIEIAAVVADSDGSWELQAGRHAIVAADWSQVNDFSWYNEDSVAVLGIQADSQVLGLYQIYADGSSVYDSLTELPVEASPPANTTQFVWNSGGLPIAAARNGGKNKLYTLSVEGQDAQTVSSVTGTSPSY